MAASFWTSSHSKHLSDPEDINQVLAADVQKGLTLHDVKIIRVHFFNVIRTLGSLVKVRQRVIATAVTFFHRVYHHRAYSELSPWRVGPACLYLASKVEESTVHAKLIVSHAKKLPIFHGSIDVKDILEMEMKLLESLNYHLVVFHPYRPLTMFLKDSGLTKEVGHYAWSMLNDTYRVNVGLFYAPNQIAIACIHMAAVLKGCDGAALAWLQELRTDMNVVRNITLELLDFFSSYRVISDGDLLASLSKIKPGN